jgi:hypothetical protein
MRNRFRPKYKDESGMGGRLCRFWRKCIGHLDSHIWNKNLTQLNLKSYIQIYLSMKDEYYRNTFSGTSPFNKEFVAEGPSLRRRYVEFTCRHRAHTRNRIPVQYSWSSIIIHLPLLSSRKLAEAAELSSIDNRAPQKGFPGNAWLLSRLVIGS